MPKPKPHQAAKPKPPLSSSSSLPSWPPFPSLPVTTLTPTPLASSPTQPAKILLVRNLFPRSLARTYTAFLHTLPLIATPPPPPHKRAEYAARVNDRFQVQDAAFARRLWTETGLQDVLVGEEADDDTKSLWGGEVVGLNPNIRIYRYSEGQFFGCHYDDFNLVTIPSGNDAKEVAAKTVWTLLLYLTSEADGCVGGETVFYPNDNMSPDEAIAVSPETGMLLLHKHGDDCMLHEGRPVTSGEKWVIRTDLCIKR